MIHDIKNLHRFDFSTTLGGVRTWSGSTAWAMASSFYSPRLEHAPQARAHHHLNCRWAAVLWL